MSEQRRCGKKRIYDKIDEHNSPKVSKCTRCGNSPCQCDAEPKEPPDKPAEVDKQAILERLKTHMGYTPEIGQYVEWIEIEKELGGGK